MVYGTIAKYSKSAAHALVEMTFPKTPSIAMVSVVAGSYAWHLVDTHATSITRIAIMSVTGSSNEFYLDYVLLPSIVPYLRPYLSSQISILTTLSTSLVLNQSTLAVDWICTQVKKHQPIHKIKTLLLENNAAVPQNSEFVIDCILELREEEELEKIKNQKLEPAPPTPLELPTCEQPSIKLLLKNSAAVNKVESELNLPNASIPTSQTISVTETPTEPEAGEKAKELLLAKEIYKHESQKKRLCGYCKLWA